MMYLEHFGLREAPFGITPHTEFFFSGAKRGATLDALIYAITHDEGIVKVTGEVGSGKTMLCRMLLEKLPPQIETIYLASPTLHADDILHALADELEIALPDGRRHRMLRTLQDHLLGIYAAGQRVVVMIDEAHAMPAATLEEIRLLSNLESARHKLLHIVLFGQPELDARLSAHDMRQLKDRITHNFTLEPMHREDVGSYIDFRLRAAGYRGPHLFTPKAIRLLCGASGGLTRRINILADKGLLAAFADGRYQVDARQMRSAIGDAQFAPVSNNSPRRWQPRFLAGAALAVALVVALRWPLPPAAPPSAAADASPPTAEAQPAMVSPAPTTASPAPMSLDDRVAATEAWLKATPETHYFIQLLSTDASNPAEIERYLASAASRLDAQQLRVYRSRLSGRDRYGVIYGDFATQTAANAELARLSGSGLADRPYIRAVSKLR